MRDEMLNGDEASQEYFSMADLADRWRCSRGTVYNRLRAEGAQVLDFDPRGKKGRKVVPASVIKQIEARNMRRLT
jgi:biotin operon repressor